MPDVLARLGLAVDTRSMDRAADSQRRFVRGARDVERQSARTTSATDRLGVSFKALAVSATGAFSAFTAGRAVLNATESYTRMANSLRILGVEQGEVNGRINDLNDIASRTRTPLQAITTLYQRASIAAGELGASQVQLQQFTENVGYALGQTGAGAQEASGALLQLSQALGGGVVRAEEFNSILEGAYPIAQAAARGIDEAGGSVARLRQLVIDGNVSSKDFFDAILSQSEQLRETFAQTAPTIGQAMQRIADSFTLLVGQFDAAVGASSGIAQAMILLADNLDRVAAYGATAAALFAGKYVTGFVAARLATLSLSGALTVLRGAIIRTGFGALVVGAGEGVYQFGKLVKATGSFGNAMSLMGDVAVEVWGRIRTGAAAMVETMNALWQSMKASFLGAISEMGGEFQDFVWRVGNAFRDIPGMGAFASQMDSVGAAIEAVGAPIARAASEAQKASDTYRQSAQELFAAASAPLSSLEALRSATVDAGGEMESGAGAADRLSASLDDLGSGGGGGGSAGKAAKKLDELKTEAQAFNDAMKEAAWTAEDFGTEKANILVGGVDSVANAFGDFMSRGLLDFKGMVKSILGGFQSMLSQMIAMAARNRIMIGLGMGGGMGGAAQASGLMGKASGLIGGFGQGGSMLGSAALGLGGGSGLLGGLGNAVSGGLGGLFNIGGSAAAAGGGLAATIGAALPAVGLATVAISALFGKTKELDRGLRVTVDGMDALVETFKKTEKSRLFGLIKSKDTNYDDADAALADPIEGAIAGLQSSVLDAASVLGVGAGAFDKFSTQIKLSTKGMSDEEAQKAITDALSGMGDEMAAVALKGHDVIEAGEGATATLQRLSDSLTAVNDISDLLGHGMQAISIAGGAASAEIVAAAGGMQALQSGAQAYFDNFYSDQERQATTLRRLSDAFSAIGAVMPSTRQGFRQLVEGIDTTTASGREMYGQVISLSAAMNEALPAAGNLTRAMQGLVSKIGGQIGVQIDQATEAARQAGENARLWLRTADTLKDFLSDLLNSDLTAASRGQQLEANAMRYRDAVTAARGGDADAAGRVPELSRAYLESIRASAVSELDYRRAASRVQYEVERLGQAAEFEGARNNALEGLYTRLSDVLTQLGQYIEAGALTDAKLGEFDGSIGSLQKAIKEVENFSYDFFGANGLKIDPTSAFTKWYQTETENKVAQPMWALRDSLNELRLQIAVEAAREQKLAGIQAKMSEAQGWASKHTGQAQSVIAQIEALERQTGVSLRKGSGDARLGIGADGMVDYSASHVEYGKGADLDAFRKAFWAKGGLEDQLQKAMADRANDERWMKSLREQVTKVSAADNRELVDEMRALRQETAKMREENRQLQLQITKNTKKSADLAKKADVIGQPPVRVS